MSIIKKHLLGCLGVGDEYVIDPEKVNPEPVQRSHAHGDTASPEEIAGSIISEAEQQSEAIVLAAREEADGIRAAAYQEGYEAGLRELDARKAEIEERLVEIDKDAQKQVSDFWVAIEPEIIKLSVEIAGKIIYRQTSENSEFVLENVKAALRQLRDRHELRIRVSPSDYEFMREHKEEIISSCDGVRSVEIVEDRRVGDGGSLIESANGHLDARISTQISEVEKALLEAAHDGKYDVAA